MSIVEEEAAAKTAFAEVKATWLELPSDQGRKKEERQGRWWRLIVIGSEYRLQCEASDYVITRKGVIYDYATRRTVRDASAWRAAVICLATAGQCVWAVRVHNWPLE